MHLARKLWLVVAVVHTFSSVTTTVNANPFQIFKRHFVPGSDNSMSPRQGRNSKLMSFAVNADEPTDAPALSLADTDDDEVLDNDTDNIDKEPETVPEVEIETETDIEDKLANASLLDLEESVTEVLMNSLLEELSNQEDRGGKDHEDKIGLTGEEPDFGTQEMDVVPKDKATLNSLPQSQIYQFKQQSPALYNGGNPSYAASVPSPAIRTQQPNFFPDEYEQFKQFQALQQQLQQRQQGKFAAAPQQQQQQYGNAQPRSTSGLSSDFGPNMGSDVVAQDPETNNYASQPQLERFSLNGAEDSMQLNDPDQTLVGERQNQIGNGLNDQTTLTTTTEATTEAPGVTQAFAQVDDNNDDDKVRCINKVMQVEETVYEERIKCQHTFTEKCHDTFITDYVPTQEKKCETSFKKNCHITYKPMMFEEVVNVCNEPLQKKCSDNTVGEEVCKTHYETICETRYKEHEVEQDEPVCEMVVERKCNGITVPLREDNSIIRSSSNGERFKRQAPQLTDASNSNLGFLQNQELATIGEECEDWPIQKCHLEKRTVKKTNPETSCQKMPREICAPSNCVFEKSEKICRDENRNLVQNIPSEQCDLEPQETCKMETVLVPRLTKQPNCIKVPKEICVNAKTNPRKVKRPVIKEWCYKPSDLNSPTSRAALSQFFKQ